MIRESLFALSLVISAQINAQQILFTPAARAQVETRFNPVPFHNADRAARLRELFAAIHCDDYQEQSVKGSKLPNLICTLKGSGDGTVIVGAHYDKLEPSRSQGAIDNWSSASLLPSLYEALAQRPRNTSYIFIGFTDEEKGLAGSTFYVKSLSTELRSKILADVNIDSIGMTTTKVWVSRADKQLLKDAAAAAQAFNLPIAGMDVDRVGDSDSHPFADRKIPVIDFHSLVQNNLRVLHSVRDTDAAINWDAYYDTYRLLCAFLALLDATPG